MCVMDGSGTDGSVRLAVHPGHGRIARHGREVLFVPDAEEHHHHRVIDELVARFLRGDRSAIEDPAVPLCAIRWSESGDHVEYDSMCDLTFDRTDGALVITNATDADRVVPPTDLQAGHVFAGGFSLVFRTEPATVSTTRREPRQSAASNRLADITAESPQFLGLADLDVTLAPFGPITYPDDDTDRTFRRPGDVRCPRGHANPNTNVVCRLCGDPLDSTASRSGPRASTAVAGLRLPDGSVIPINRTIVLGRSPTADAARLVVGSPRLVSIEGAGTVSRTHVIVRVEVGEISVTDCDARGRTAVVTADDPSPIALTPWQPRTVDIGDTIHLGGQTTLTITDPEALRVPAAFERTERPPDEPAPQSAERDETT